MKDLPDRVGTLVLDIVNVLPEGKYLLIPHPNPDFSESCYLIEIRDHNDTLVFRYEASSYTECLTLAMKDINAWTDK